MTGPAIDRRRFLTGVSAVAVATLLPATDEDVRAIFAAWGPPRPALTSSQLIFRSPPCRGYSLPIIDLCPVSGRLFFVEDMVVVSRVVPGTERDNA